MSTTSPKYELNLTKAGGETRSTLDPAGCTMTTCRASGRRLERILGNKSASSRFAKTSREKLGHEGDEEDEDAEDDLDASIETSASGTSTVDRIARSGRIDRDQRIGHIDANRIARSGARAANLHVYSRSEPSARPLTRTQLVVHQRRLSLLAWLPALQTSMSNARRRF
ncbi:unnamed protein product [Zymoseptoria tritici ST99CH_3D1]|uniref:Uncharacterized protein n=1 Tax=Zymoseptoria tritici ST99CH_1E4 TaxID=1276532 RepID=A0A2H1H934_ZYMTR|nr:unnamed protein product [Zymoseptoria tritici ST99CH_1E4]SMR64742.1 unnamed protein product [Zymoseptoria tritici ST99CH_3D1]